MLSFHFLTSNYYYYCDRPYLSSYGLVEQYFHNLDVYNNKFHVLLTKLDDQCAKVDPSTSFFSLLIEPVQRPPRIKLQFEHLLKETTPNTKEFEDCQNFLKAISSVISSMNQDNEILEKMEQIRLLSVCFTEVSLEEKYEPHKDYKNSVKREETLVNCFYRARKLGKTKVSRITDTYTSEDDSNQSIFINDYSYLKDFRFGSASTPTKSTAERFSENSQTLMEGMKKIRSGFRNSFKNLMALDGLQNIGQITEKTAKTLPPTSINSASSNNGSISDITSPAKNETNLRRDSTLRSRRGSLFEGMKRFNNNNNLNNINDVEKTLKASGSASLISKNQRFTNSTYQHASGSKTPDEKTQAESTKLTSTTPPRCSSRQSIEKSPHNDDSVDVSQLTSRSNDDNLSPLPFTSLSSENRDILASDGSGRSSKISIPQVHSFKSKAAEKLMMKFSMTKKLPQLSDSHSAMYPTAAENQNHLASSFTGCASTSSLYNQIETIGPSSILNKADDITDYKQDQQQSLDSLLLDTVDAKPVQEEIVVDPQNSTQNISAGDQQFYDGRTPRYGSPRRHSLCELKTNASSSSLHSLHLRDLMAKKIKK